MEDSPMPSWALPVTLLVGGLLLALIRVVFGMDKKAAKKRTSSNATAVQNPNKSKQLRLIKREEVAQHASDTDLWLIIKNKAIDRMCVYDLTEYVESHPGGDAILTNAGGDATEGFHGPQHPATVHDLVREYLIGYLDE